MLIAWFYFPSLIMWCMWKTCFLCFKINYFNYLYFHSMPWLVCWVVSDFLKAEWLKGWKRKRTKMEGKCETEFWRNWHPRDRMGDADACQARRSSDAAAWLTRPRDKESSEWHEHVTHADTWQRPRTRNCRKRSQRILKPFLAQIQVQKA